MLPQEIIWKKRDGHTLSAEEIQFYIGGISKGLVNESHIAAFSMAVVFNGMTIDEIYHLTNQMVKSGDTLNWDNLDGPVIDKHSTGGVGDKISLMLAPIIAACGIFNPMISGRGLGHTGGTLDKLIRAFDTLTGEELWSHELPYIGSAPPTVYAVNGEQFIIIPATGGMSLARIYPDLVEQGDAFVAFKLKKD